MNAILVGVRTYDASPLILEPRHETSPNGAPAKRNGAHGPGLR